MESSLQDQRRLMASGQLYNDLTPELIHARADALNLTNEYNASIGRDAACREKILRKLLKSVGPGTFFEPAFRCEFGFNIITGKDFYANFDCIILDGASVEIGDSVFRRHCGRRASACHKADHRKRPKRISCLGPRNRRPHQRKRRPPANHPAITTITVAIMYQTARNKGESSGQFIA